MSIQQVSKFYNEVVNDEGLKSKLHSINEKTLTREIFADKIMPEAKKKGYNFSYADVQEYYKKQNEKTELSVDDVEAVSGGCGGSSGGGSSDGLVIGLNDPYAENCSQYEPIKSGDEVCGNCRNFNKSTHKCFRNVR